MGWGGRGNTLAGMSYKGVSLLNTRICLGGIRKDVTGALSGIWRSPMQRTNREAI